MVSSNDGGATGITPETLRPRRSSAVWLLLGSSVFVAIGLWMGSEEGWIGYAIAAFFGTCAAVGLVQLLPGASSLRIDCDGLTCRSLYSRFAVRWDEVDRFFVVALRQGGFRVHEVVGWNYLAGRGPPGRGRRLSFALTGCEGALPDTYGVKPAELADRLNGLLERSRSG